MTKAGATYYPLVNGPVSHLQYLQMLLTERIEGIFLLLQKLSSSTPSVACRYTVHMVSRRSLASGSSKDAAPEAENVASIVPSDVPTDG
jgi:hypothetical protein